MYNKSSRFFYFIFFFTSISEMRTGVESGEKGESSNSEASKHEILAGFASFCTMRLRLRMQGHKTNQTTNGLRGLHGCFTPFYAGRFVCSLCEELLLLLIPLVLLVLLLLLPPGGKP